MNNLQAFPSHYETIIGSRLEETEQKVLRSKEGMTLRDYFAGQALTGYLASSNLSLNALNESIVKNCYAIADVMLAERERKAVGNE